METLRVAVVDDDETVGILIETIARRMGATTARWNEPRAFLEALDQWQPTHVVLDMRMPVMTGAEVLFELVRRRCTARLILTSGDPDDARAAEQLWCRDVDVAGVLPKPFAAASLRALLS